MTDPTQRYERDCAYLHTKQEQTDIANLKKGTRLYHMSRRYGAGTIEAVGKEMKIGRSSAFDYARVAAFLWEWRRYRAWCIFEDFPMLGYTHLREATYLDFEESIDELIAANDKGLTADEFAARIAELQGKHTATRPYFKQRGMGYEVWRNLQTFAADWQHEEVEITVRPVKRNGK